MALSADRNTATRSPGTMTVRKVKGSTTIYNGSMVAVVAGYLVPAGDTSGHVVVGRACQKVDNSAGSDGDKTCEVLEGTFKWAINSTDLAQAQVGTNATVYDDFTCSKASVTTNDIVVGVVKEIDADGGVWVETRIK